MVVLMLPRVSSRVSGFPVASPCLWGKLQNLFFSNVSKQVVMLFCVAGMALCDIPTCLITCRKSFCVAGAILLRRLRKMSSSFRGSRSILEISVVILRGRRSTPDSTLHTLPFTLHTLHSTLYAWHFTLHTLHGSYLACGCKMCQSLVAVKTFIFFLPEAIFFKLPQVIAVFAWQVQHFKV